MQLGTINDLGAHTAPLAEALIAAMQRVVSSGWFVLGPEVRAFEEEFAAYCGTRHCVGVASGTDALELLLRALEVGPQDEVVAAPNAGMYSTTAILAVGATPVYADVDPAKLTLSPQAVDPHITPRTKVVITTHLFGRMADVAALRALTEQHGLALVEDCAQCHGASLNGKRAGSWGDGAAFSFYPTKNLGALGDAGAVVTSDVALARRVKNLRQYGWEDKYIAPYRGGRNSRLDELQAALLRVKLGFLDRWNAQRRAVAKCYSATLEHPDILTPPVDGDDYVAHLYVARSARRDSLRDYLKQHGVATDVHYPLLDYQQPLMKRDYRQVYLPISEQAVGEVVTLPCYPELDLDDVRRGCDIINRWER